MILFAADNYTIANMNDSPPTPQLPLEIDVAAVKGMLDGQEDFLLIDCREPAEHCYCNIAGALLVPMNDTPDRIAELEPYRDCTVIIYCHLGIRSLQVASWLRMEGFAKSRSMAGGIEAWSQRIDSSIPRY
jgi:rhodanese-related sulfurtransferase